MSIPAAIRRYRIDRRIGHGSMAILRLAIDPAMQRAAAGRNRARVEAILTSHVPH